jgi:coiled-coil and C2 domain-containing protein 2A
MWFNIQQFEEPHRIRFDVSNPSHWKPFFGKTSEANKFESIQPEKLIYTKTNLRYVSELEAKIERNLIDRLKSWRIQRRTRFNPLVTNALRKVLLEMERNRDSSMVELQNEPEILIDIQKSYKISGFPINLPYTNMQAILEAVYATQVHAIPSNEVEYALAVNIYPYPNTILSVWVYVAVVTKRE